MIIVGLAVSIIGSRQVNGKADDLPHAASAATVDPGLIALTVYGMDSHPVSEALGSDRVVSLQQQVDNRWCVETEVSALLSSHTVFFVIDDAGQFVETSDCRGSLITTSRVRRPPGRICGVRSRADG